MALRPKETTLCFQLYFQAEAYSEKCLADFLEVGVHPKDLTLKVLSERKYEKCLEVGDFEGAFKMAELQYECLKVTDRIFD